MTRKGDRLKAAEMAYWRRSAAVTRLYRVRNETILKRMQVEYTITKTILDEQLILYEALRRMTEERIFRKIWNWVLHERNKRERHPTKWKII